MDTSQYSIEISVEIMHSRNSLNHHALISYIVRTDQKLIGFENRLQI